MERLLKDGNAIVLFDGLDEVNVEDNKRANMIQALNDFKNLNMVTALSWPLAA